MRVMHVRHVRVLMSQRLVLVRMRMRLGGRVRSYMGVSVMDVMHMRMCMYESLVKMLICRLKALVARRVARMSAYGTKRRPHTKPVEFAPVQQSHPYSLYHGVPCANRGRSRRWRRIKGLLLAGAEQADGGAKFWGRASRRVSNGSTDVQD